MFIDKKIGVPGYEIISCKEKSSKYCVLIPIINERQNIELELNRAMASNAFSCCDCIICDGGSTDGSNDPSFLSSLGVTTLLIKKTAGKQGAQLRMGFDYALNAGYEGFITIDGNNKDSIEDLKSFVDKLEEGYDLVQGSRFIEGGEEINTPLFRKIMVKFIHAPIISLTAHKRFTDTTNAYRAYSKKYITDERVDLFRDIFDGYELLAYTSTRATQIGLKACEIPVKREYPKGKVPTKIKGFKGNFVLLKILFLNMFGYYKPTAKAKKTFRIYSFATLILTLSFLALTVFFVYKSTRDYSLAISNKQAEIVALQYDESGNEKELDDEQKKELLILNDELSYITSKSIDKTGLIVFSALSIMSAICSTCFFSLTSSLDKKEGDR